MYYKYYRGYVKYICICLEIPLVNKTTCAVKAQ